MLRNLVLLLLLLLSLSAALQLRAAALPRGLSPRMAGGFGPSAQVAKKPPAKKKTKKKAATRRRDAAEPVEGGGTRLRAASEEERRDAHMAAVRAAIRAHVDAIAAGLEADGYAVIDDFLGADAIAAMRAECAALRAGGFMYASKSTRFDEEAGSIVEYEKHNVLSANLQGGSACAPYCARRTSASDSSNLGRLPPVDRRLRALCARV